MFRSLAVSIFVLPILAGCVSKNEQMNENPDLEVLPRLAIAGASLQEGDSVKYNDLIVTVKKIDEESYPSTVALFDGKKETIIPLGKWEIMDDVLIRTDFQGKNAQASGGFILLSFHDLNMLMNKPAPQPAGKLMSEQKFSEGSIKFMKDGFVSLNAIRENDQIRRDDETAEVEVYFEGQSIEATVREHSHTLINSKLVLGAGEIFAGDLPGRGTTSISISTQEIAWKDAIDSQEVLIKTGEPLGFDLFQLSLDSMPVAPPTAEEGQPVAPTSYRALVTTRDIENHTNDYILLPGQSLRLGRKEFMLKTIDESSGVFDVYTFKDELLASNRRNANDPIEKPNSDQYGDVQPTNTSLTMQVGDALDFWDARFEVVRITENDRTNLFDDEATFSIVGRGVSENLTVREGSRYTVRGENRWWVIKANSIDKNGRVGEIELELETGQFLGGSQRN